LNTLDVCYQGTKNLLELAKNNKAIFFHTSTSEVYGDPLEHPQKESYKGNVNPIGIRACYDEGKRVAETMIFEYKRLFNLDTRVVRIFNTYGPNMQSDDGRVVSNFITQALSGNKLTIYGDGSQTRSFCYVDDLIKGFNSMIFASSSPTIPINMGNPNEFTILELAQNVLKLVGDTELSFKDLPSDDPERRKPDISLAKEFYDWQPTIELEEGLSKTINYFKNNKEKVYVR
jgi:UDP-glucuronate decarboxylase